MWQKQRKQIKIAEPQNNIQAIKSYKYLVSGSLLEEEAVGSNPVKPLMNDTRRSNAELVRNIHSLQKIER